MKTRALNQTPGKIRAPQCPKCGAELEDFYDEFDDWGWCAKDDAARFKCRGKLLKPKKYAWCSEDCALNRTKSCGYFGLADLGGKA